MQGDANEIVLSIKLDRLPGEKPGEYKGREDRFRSKIESYAKFLTEDYEGDWAPLIRLLVFRMKRLRTSIKKGMCVNCKQTAKTMDAPIALLEKVLEDDYHATAFREFHQKHGEPKMVLGRKQKDAKGRVSYPVEFIYGNGKPADEEMRKEMRRLYKEEERLRQQDIDEAFRLIAKHLREWWD
ncbi:MAG: hypothetical protein NTW87_00850 [Planctomycetota bacterium]|nr:hypothetical protein [Planctomycetota bacterium]